MTDWWVVGGRKGTRVTALPSSSLLPPPPSCCIYTGQLPARPPMSYLLRFLIFSSDAASFRINVDGVFRPDRNSLYVYVYELFLTGKTSLEKVPVSIESIYIYTRAHSLSYVPELKISFLNSLLKLYLVEEREIFKWWRC